VKFWRTPTPDGVQVTLELTTEEISDAPMRDVAMDAILSMGEPDDSRIVSATLFMLSVLVGEIEVAAIVADALRDAAGEEEPEDGP
jgi:hypothetical protein